MRFPSTGEPLFIEALRPGKSYDDSETNHENTDDLVLIPNNGYIICDKIKKNKAIKFLPEDCTSGNHHYDGMYIFNGPNIRKGHGPGHIVDILPTIYALLGIELPSYIDGHPMQNIFDKQISVGYQQCSDNLLKKVRTDTGLQSEEELQIMKRIKALGYCQ